MKTEYRGRQKVCGVFVNLVSTQEDRDDRDAKRPTYRGPLGLGTNFPSKVPSSRVPVPVFLALFISFSFSLSL